MNKKIIYTSLFGAMLCPLTLIRGEWVTIADFDSYQTGWGEPELQAEGWIMQDGDYAGYIQCTDGTNDCTALRAVTDAPYSPAIGSDQALILRAGDPNESLIANSLTNTAIPLPQEIPLGGKATIYVHFARESTPGHNFFCLTDIALENKGPILATGQTLDGFANMGALVHVRNDDSFAIYQDTYVPAIVESGNPDASNLEREVWYEMWIQVDNQALTTGDQLGTRFDVYIRGGKFGDGEPFHVVNTVPAYANNGYTEWFFRRNVDEPVRTFNLIAQYGNPASNPRGTGALWINELAMFTDFTLARPGAEDCGSDWHGYPVTDCWADTGDWMGWLYIKHDPWIYSEDIGWFYEGSVENDGGWIYALK